MGRKIMVPVGEIIVFPMLLFLSLFVINSISAEIKTYRHCIKYGTEAKGKIVEFKNRGPRSGYSPVFNFKYKGETERKMAFQRFTLFIKLRFPDEAPIYYCEDYPDFVVIKGKGQYISTALVLILFSCMLLFCVVMMLSLNFPFNLLCFAIVAVVLLFYFGKRRKM